MDREIFNQLRRLDRHELRRVMIFARGLLLSMGEDPRTLDELHATEDGAKVTYRLEMVKCGRAGCRSCPHGPYWYAYYREGTRLRSRYIGKELPDSARLEGDSVD